MVSRLVLPDDLYIPLQRVQCYFSECPRITQRIAMDTNEFAKRVFAGEYIDTPLDPPQNDPTGGNQIQGCYQSNVGISQSGEPEGSLFY